MNYANCDSVVKTVIESFITRSKFGMEKYNTDLDRTDLNLNDWVQHAQEEHMDAILYLEKIKQIVSDSDQMASFAHSSNRTYSFQELANYNYSYLKFSLSLGITMFTDIFDFCGYNTTKND